MEERIADLQNYHLVVELSLSSVLTFCISNEKLKDYIKAKEYYSNRSTEEEKHLIEDVENIIKKIYDTLEIVIGRNIYKILLKPFYDSYHHDWVRKDFEAFIYDIDEYQIYVIITEPGSWNDFSLILEKTKQLYEDSNYQHYDVFYVNVPWTLPIHRWK